MNLNSYPAWFTKPNLKWGIGLNVKPKSKKLPKENVEENLCNLGLEKVLGFFVLFSDGTQNHNHNRKKIGKLDFFKFKRCALQVTVLGN